MPLNKKSVPIGQSTTFGLGIRNTYEETKQFYLQINFARAYDRNEEVLTEPDATHIESKWVLYPRGPHNIPPNEFVSIPLLLNVDTKMAEGVNTAKDAIYTFNVCVFDDAGQVTDCVMLGGNRELLNRVYGGKVLKINLETR
jgi:hypothetical protein